MASNDFKMKYVIDADASKAKAAFNDLDKRIGGITSSIGSLGGLSGTAIAGALTGIATAGAAVGAAMFQMTKSASEFGSTIYDASVKTGLGATSISALKLAADQSGSSLEQVTGGIAKFAKTVGAAGEGSKEAAAKLKSLGIEPVAALNDLDGSLDKVFKRIGEARPGVERITLAQKAFGKSGADLIPLMEQVGFNFEAFRKRAEELGITIDRKAMVAADEFDDQMVELDAQLKAVGRTIGFELMPVFKDMATSMSTWLASNKDEVRSWGTLTANILRGVVDYWNEAAAAAQRYSFLAGAAGGAASQADSGTFMGAALLGGVGGLLARKGQQGRPQILDSPRDLKLGGYSAPRAPAGFGSDIGGGSGGSGKIRKPPKESDSEFRRFFEEQGFKINRTYGSAINAGSPHPYGGAADVGIHGKNIDQIFQLMVKALEKGYRVLDERVKLAGVKQTGPHLHFENAKTMLTKGSVFGKDFDPAQLAYLQNLDKDRLGKATGMGGFEDFQGKQAADAQKAAEEETAGLMDAWNEFRDWEEQQVSTRLQTRQAEASQAVEILQGQLREQMIDEVDYADRVGQLRIDMLEEERREVESLTPTAENLHRLDLLRLEIGTARVKKENDVAEAIERQNKAFLDQLDALAGLQKKNKRPGTLKTREEDIGIFDGIFDADKIKDAEQVHREMMGSIRDMTTDTFGSMAEAIGQSIAAWALYGDSIGASLQKATAAILANLAAQAITQAVWETAQGFAMLALALFGNPGAGASAAAHFQAAAIYATVGAGAALGAKAVGGGGKGASGGAGAGSGSSYDANAGPATYSRVSPDAFMSGQRRQADSMLEAVLRRLTDKMDAMRPGDVLVNGMRQRPGVVGAQAVSDVKRNAGTGRDLGRAIGLR